MGQFQSRASPAQALIVNLCFYDVNAPDTPAPYGGDPPPEAGTDYISDGRVYMREVREPPNSAIDGSMWPASPGHGEIAFSAQHARKPWWKLW
jgi:hypothetical protein